MVGAAGLTLRLRRALIGAGTTYATALATYAILRRSLCSVPSALELIDDFTPWWYLPAPVILVAGVATRSRRLLASGIAAAAAFCAVCGPLVLRRSRPRADAGRIGLTVMTFNILAWDRDHASTAETILSAAPDVVGLQELHVDAAGDLVQLLGSEYPYRALHPGKDTSGSGIFSRYPLRDSMALRLSERGHWLHRAVIETPGGPVTLFSVRMPVPRVPRPPDRPVLLGLFSEFQPARRRSQVRALLALIRRAERPVIVLGDFNMTEYSADYRLLRAELRDAYRAVGRGFGHTFPRAGARPRALPAPWPVLRLDYVWHSPELVPVAAHVGRASASDHLPVVVRFNHAFGAARPSLVAQIAQFAPNLGTRDQLLHAQHGA